jgi:uncharacterized protein YbjQ (UPF0145 family)
MIVTTTPDVQDKKVSEYLGIVFGEAIIGANIFKDIMASVRDIVGGRAAGYEKGLRTAREEALREMAMMAKERGADAVIAVDLDYEVLGASNGMLMVTASGTAVTLG